MQSQSIRPSLYFSVFGVWVSITRPTFIAHPEEKAAVSCSSSEKCAPIKFSGKVLITLMEPQIIPKHVCVSDREEPSSRVLVSLAGRACGFGGTDRWTQVSNLVHFVQCTSPAVKGMKVTDTWSDANQLSCSALDDVELLEYFWNCSHQVFGIENNEFLHTNKHSKKAPIEHLYNEITTNLLQSELFIFLLQYTHKHWCLVKPYLRLTLTEAIESIV